ncbi:hypothetical protein [Sulfitobacter pontiacus]|uniref:beta-sandwich lipoprotein n=1 Tax=Sulfitobacter pontiacus TaxID=60137 RepID=UPI003F5CC083
MKKLLLALAVTPALAACLPDAQVASSNLSKAADMFEIQRKIVFYNGITDKYIAVIEGRCSIEPKQDRLEVTCKTGPQAFEKHFLGISDNVTYFAMQTETVDVSVYHTRVIWKPQSILVDVDLNVDGQELTTDRN